ncbi:Phosphatidylinositol 4-phosphate 5-kinase its3-like protein [Elsinoe fawcettii]|nr:Phosphatidylinositol 4-phosphate 5-kinase its3-like protein [Elsinoe fawcettii]
MLNGNIEQTLVVNKTRISNGAIQPPQTFQQPLDDDAARWAERIKERRISTKRRKVEELDDDRVLIGQKVAEGHENFETAYNMLTGIRFCVSRCNAKLDRDLTPADFRERRKTNFDVLGTELTPATKYDFKFKDYAPWVFRHLRELFNIDPATYLMSLTDKYILSELGSPGKSGSFFYFSRDYKYIIKTLHHHEAKFLRKILPKYYEHVRANPDTLLSQFYGLHRVKTSTGDLKYCVVMNNLFPAHKDIHRTYDLKGSLVGRELDESLLIKNPQATLKDLNWLNRNMHLEFGPAKGDKLKEQMERDVRFLQDCGIMDYSLLVGIHDLNRGNADNIRNKTLKVFQPGGERIHSSSTNMTNLTSLNEAATTTSFELPTNASSTGLASQQSNQPFPNLLTRTPSKIENARKASQLRQLVKAERPVPMDQTRNRMPERQLDHDAKKGTFFYGEEGGLRASHLDDRAGDEIYYLGIIDCLTKYSMIKRGEHLWKSFSQPDAEISAVPPRRYGERFLEFMRKAVAPREQGGEMEL